MVPIKLFLCLSFFILSDSFTYGAPDNPEKIELRVGELYDLELEGTKNLNLSKKGIVVLSYLAPNKWRMVAHRKGFVVLSYQEKNTQKIRQKFIYVKQEKLAKSQKKKYPWFCKKSGINCKGDPWLITGKTNLWSLFFLAKNWCSNKSSCVFQLTMTSRAQAFLREKLREKLPKGVHFKVDSSGIKYIAINCSKADEKISWHSKLIRALLKEIQIEFTKPIFCRHKLKPSQYEIYGKVFLLTKNYDKYWGGNTVSLQRLLRN